MAKTTPSQPTPVGIYDRQKPAGSRGIEIAAAVLSALWLAGVAGLFLTQGETTDPEGWRRLLFMLTLLSIFMPVAMLWVGVILLRTSRTMQADSQRLQSSIDAVRQALLAQARETSSSTEPSVAQKLDEIAAAARKTETALATFASTRSDSPRPRKPVPAPEEDSSNQAKLALDSPAEENVAPLANADFIRALNFPETAEDEQGFAALRRALKNRQTAQLVQASQDVLTLLSQDGIYMDDLIPDRARPEIWRQFAQGARGRAIAPLGGVRDRSSLALTSGRMKQDTIFRDAAHHFLRLFDKTFAGFEPDASDEDISALANTRTARAFMLLGRVAGTFD